MNKLFFIVLACLFSTLKLYSQEAITEAGYLKQDSILWTEYEKQTDELSRCWETMPDKQDSILNVFQEIYKKSAKRNIELAMKYASVPSGLQRLYMVRLDVSKDTLNHILNSLDADMQESFYGRNIREHILTRQIQEGDSVQTFSCIGSDGKEFDWAATDGKQLLLLYGGLGCMGEDGRQELKELYDRTSRDDLLVIVYWPCSSLKELQEIKQAYPSDYPFISDFKQEASPIRIKYGTQATPTCFLTDKQHIVRVKCTGFRTDLFNPFIE
jgi:hypothetical protein